MGLAEAEFDVIVVGAGNAAFCAAHAAAERGRRVLMLEAAPLRESGGNSYYTAGATRIPHGGLDDLRDFVEADERHDRTVVPEYTEAEFTADMERVTEGRNDAEMTGLLVTESADGVRWLSSLGMAYRLMYERQAYERPDGSFLFWGGLHVGNVGGGEGMIADHKMIAARLGVEIRYEHQVSAFLFDGERVHGVVAEHGGERSEIGAESVIIASGGFESNAEMREKHLGEGWSKAKVRGTAYNMGYPIEAALRIGAAPGGDWSTCHSVQWDAYFAENESNRELTNRLTRQSYPLGIIIDQSGRRFLDEGADFRNFTYAKYGREILARPGGIAWQIYDATLRPLLRAEEYDMPGISVIEAGTVHELAQKAGLDPVVVQATIDEYNNSIDRSIPFDPTVLDGRSAETSPRKSNWASPLESAPFFAYPVTCGITFTFGGLTGDAEGRVIRHDGGVLPGLFVCGEARGGLFSGNYPGGSGLAAGIVFGRRAGAVA